MKIKIIKFAITFSLFLLVITPALAIGKPENAGEEGLLHRLTDQNIKQSGLIRSCQAREKSIKNRMKFLIKLVNVMDDKFGKIATRVEDYYTTKVVPSGKTVPNYDLLVSDIQTKKDAVKTALANAQTDVDSFNCDQPDSKADLIKFRTDMQNVKSLLKNYRTSVKNLIVAVHSAVGEEKSTETPKKP
jgi:hypothetical protein